MAKHLGCSQLCSRRKSTRQTLAYWALSTPQWTHAPSLKATIEILSANVWLRPLRLTLLFQLSDTEAPKTATIAGHETTHMAANDVRSTACPNGRVRGAAHAETDVKHGV